MSECIGHDIALGSPLQSIISDRRGCLIAASTSPGSMNCHFSWARFAQTPARQSACSSTRTCKLLASALSIPRWALAPGAKSQLVLDVVTDLVGDHIGLGELTGFATGIATAEAPFEILEEACVEIDLLVNRAIERTHCGLRKPAAGPRRPGKHYQSWWLVRFPAWAKMSVHCASVLPSTADTKSPIASDGAPVLVVEPASDCCWARSLPGHCFRSLDEDARIDP